MSVALIAEWELLSVDLVYRHLLQCIAESSSGHPACPQIVTGNMPIPQVRPVANLILNGSSTPKRCPFYKTSQIIPLLSNAL
ncbi:hypothetical protein [Moorena producens]|uniref:hypothetical protein n=1 Tax=Moorena producens TaxID=1155739 RepID=UPI0011EA6AD8|nr:hypothetical protein [Moorena producens]